MNDAMMNMVLKMVGINPDDLPDLSRLVEALKDVPARLDRIEAILHALYAFLSDGVKPVDLTLLHQLTEKEDTNA